MLSSAQVLSHACRACRACCARYPSTQATRWTSKTRLLLFSPLPLWLQLLELLYLLLPRTGIIVNLRYLGNLWLLPYPTRSTDTAMTLQV